jgi:hypothetical protein
MHGVVVQHLVINRPLIEEIVVTSYRHSLRFA